MLSEMNAAVLYGKEDVRIERVPIPAAGKGEIVIRVHAALTCGTDLKVFRRGYHARMIAPPALFGHELAGVVHETGAGVRSFKPGMRVVALNSAPCGVCYWCVRKQENLCEDLLFNNGAYAEYIRIPARIVAKNTLIVPESLPLEHAALTEPLACVVRGLEETGAKRGDIVVVIGAGPIGLMFMHVAQLSGMKVIAVVKRDCPTCELTAPVLGELAQRVGLQVYTQDDPSFPETVPERIDDTALDFSHRLKIEIVPTLIQHVRGIYSRTLPQKKDQGINNEKEHNQNFHSAL